MGKRIVSVFMAVLVTLSFQGVCCMKDSVAYGAENKAINIVIDGEKLAFSEEDGMGVPFIDSAGRIQVPIRKPLEKVGAAVSFEVDQGSAEKNITISKGEMKINLVVLDETMRVNSDTIYQMDTSPEIRDSRAYMPIRAVFEVLGYSVSWDNASMTVEISELAEKPSAPVTISKSAVTPVGQFEIPQYKGKEEDEPEVIVNHGYIYYLDENNDIMQTTFSDLTKSKKVYHCSGWAVHLFNDENGVPRLYYHTEGASMGSPHQFALNTDGSITELNGRREYAGEVYSTGGKTFAFTELKFGPDRLEIKNEEGAYVNLGGSENRYEYRSEIDGFNGRRGVYLIGDELYLLATPFSGDAGEAVYRVNIKMDEAVRITDQAYGIQIEGNYLYYNTGKEIRKRNLEDGTEISMYNFNGSATNFASDFTVLNGNLYIADRNRFFIAASSQGEESPFEEGNYIIVCYDMALRGDNGEQYLICQIRRTDIKNGTASSWMRVYDKEGKMIMERAGDINPNSVSVEGDKICYYDGTSRKIIVEEIK